MEASVPNTPLDLEGLSKVYLEAGFTVRATDKSEETKRFRIEWSIRSAEDAKIFRVSLGEAILTRVSARPDFFYELSTYYKPLKGPDIAERDRLILEYETDQDLRSFFIEAMESYNNLIKVVRANNPTPKTVRLAL